MLRCGRTPHHKHGPKETSSPGPQRNVALRPNAGRRHLSSASPVRPRKKVEVTQHSATTRDSRSACVSIPSQRLMLILIASERYVNEKPPIAQYHQGGKYHDQPRSYGGQPGSSPAFLPPSKKLPSKTTLMAGMQLSLNNRLWRTPPNHRNGLKDCNRAGAISVFRGATPIGQHAGQPRTARQPYSIAPFGQIPTVFPPALAACYT